jgi:hypothetical protein
MNKVTCGATPFRRDHSAKAAASGLIFGANARHWCGAIYACAAHPTDRNFPGRRFCGSLAGRNERT